MPVHFSPKIGIRLFILVIGVVLVGTGAVWGIGYMDERSQMLQERASLQKRTEELTANVASLHDTVASVSASYTKLESEDQRVRNNTLEEEINHIHAQYQAAVASYESLLSVKEQSGSTSNLDAGFANVLVLLSNRKYTEADAAITKLNQDIDTVKSDIAKKLAADAAKAIADAQAKAAADAKALGQASVPQSNAAPGGGYVRQSVNAEGVNYIVDIVAGNLQSTKVVVDTASDSDCSNNCPVMSLGRYVNRSSAYAGVNGSYFCPASYPTCAGKTNSYDTLIMNKNKTYFNSANNVYSTVPAFIFLGGSVRVVERSLEWGRDTGIDSMIANQPLLLYNGEIKFTGDGDPKKSNKGTRGFVANKGNTVYIGMVQNVTVAEMAKVMKAMGLDNALNLDSGGSAAFWVNGGYKIGPGRDIPNAILFLHR